MKTILWLPTFACSVMVTSLGAQGLVRFANPLQPLERISTNAVVGGPATGFISRNATAVYDFALFESTTATLVGGTLSTAESGYIPGATSYAFADPLWSLVDYGVNLNPVGRFIGDDQKAMGYTVVPGVPPGASAQFVVVGWSDNLGSTLGELEASLENPVPGLTGFLGESAVSGPIVLGDNLVSPPSLLFSPNGYPCLQGFTLGEFVPEPAPLALAGLGGLLVWLVIAASLPRSAGARPK